jgi:MFS family permease
LLSLWSICCYLNWKGRVFSLVPPRHVVWDLCCLVCQRFNTSILKHILTGNTGYDQGVFGGLLANPNFLGTFNNPGTTLQGQIVSTYTIGCIFGALLSLVIGDMLGRRRSVALGCAFLTVGGILQATAYTLPHMIVGRVIGGLGIGVNTTTIPMWQSETCKPSLRGKLVAIQLTFLVFGFVLTNWMNFGFTYLPNNPVRNQRVEPKMISETLS